MISDQTIIKSIKMVIYRMFHVKHSQKEVDLLFNEAQQLVYSLTLNHGLILEIIEKLWKRVR